MTIKMKEETRAPQAEVVVPAPGIEVTEEQKQMEQALTSELTKMIKAQQAENAKRVAAMKVAGAVTEAADPGLATYQYWNVLTYGPYQFPFTDPPYRPSKIAAAGEWLLFEALIWVNPLNGPGGSLPGTIVLGGRNYTTRFQTVDLTNVTVGPARAFPDTFASPADEFTWVSWWMVAPDPGPTPRLYEVNLTVDLTLPGQPFAAFSNMHWDPDIEPAFLGLPAQPPHWHFETPARFMIYRK